MSNMRHARALLKAFQKAPHIRCFRAPPVSVQGHSRSSYLLKDADALSPVVSNVLKFKMSLLQRRAALSTTLHHGLPQVSSGTSFHTHASLSSAVSPEIAGKPDTPDTITTDDASTTIEGEVTSEPVKGAEPSAKLEAKEDPATEEDDPREEETATEISKEELLEMLGDREAELEDRDKKIQELKDKLLRSYAEVENVMQRAMREGENSRKYAVQGFAKGLLDVADNLARAGAAVPETLRQSNDSDDSSGAAKLLQTLWQGVDMTEKQLLQVFKLNGLERFDPAGQPFDPNRHSAMFEVEDPSKPPGTVASVMKNGYTLHDRVIRPAEVGVVKERSE